MFLRTSTRVQILFIAWTVIACLVLFFLLLINHFPIDIAWKDTLLSGLIISIISQILYFIQTYYHAKKPVNFFNFGLILVLTAIYQLLINSSFKIILGDERWTQYIFPFEGARAIIVFFILIAVSLYWWIQKNQQIQSQVHQQLIEQERALTKAELDNIHQQIQPHFLFNSLNSIAALTEINPQEANRMILLLSDFLRGTLRKDIQTLIPVSEEIDQIKRYLEIEKIRFGHRLKTDFQIDEACLETLVPPLLLQPVIENAIKFGLYGSTGEVTIYISVSCVNQNLLIEVRNPFDSDFIQEKTGKGFGLTSIKRRLTLLFNQNDLLITEKKDNLFITKIRIPI
ncbi:sensor histidine kinase [Fluviicola taffensis]|uniref:Signal transduction histidine kinase, LytS n=1 Tax=Fluviicola taffensis (strain DSM 16823 / NCIMB 13979 / RW262) TaxID=755732 RepID=F2IJJ8_FLUTR|nr:histidine kinase [Fluviicola taffensis]AEA42886.1 signal transduction histidine kinase, LytS [Fluviicola taffensis DSM 16823]